MAEKISVEIALEGGSEVERQLADIGKAGQKTFSDIKDAADQLDFASVSDEFQGMGDAGVQAFQKIQTAVKSAAVFEQVIQGVKNVEGAFESLGTAATRMAARMTRSLGILGVAARALGPVGIALGVAGGAFVKFGDNAADGLNKLTAASAKLDLSAQNFDKLQKALQQTGVSNDAILPGLEKLKETLAGEVFPTDVITGLKNFIAQLERMPDGAERTSLAMKTLGDSLGAQIIAGLQTGTISANNLAAALGQITPATQQQIVEAAKYQQTLNRLSAAWSAFQAAVATPLIVPLQFLIGEIQKLTAGFEGLKTTYQTLKAMLSEDFSIAWLARLVNFDPNLMLSKWLPVLQALQTTLNAVGISTPGLDALVVKAQAAAQALAQTGQAGAQAGQQAAAGLQLVANPLTGMPELINTSNQALAQTGQTGAQAGQQAAAGLQLVTNPLTGMPELINTSNQALAQTGQTGQQAFGQVGAATNQATLKTIAFKDSNLAITWDNILNAGVAAWNALTGAIQSAIDAVLKYIGLKPSAPSTGGGAPGKARGGLLGGRGSGTSDSNLAWVSRGEHIMPARVVRQPGVLSLLEALRRGGSLPRFADGGSVGGSSGALSGLINELGRAIGEVKQIWDGLIEGMQGVYQTLQKAMMDVVRQSDQVVRGTVEQLKQLQISLAVTLGHLVNAMQGNAHGGLLGGRGSGTSDSNLAWVSRGEHIMPAAVVRQPGVLAFLEALRRSGGNLRGVLDGMGRFALGGMVPRPAVAFARGGLAGGMSNVTIQFPGLPAIGGLRASSEVVEQLHKAAALAQVRSGGRKPSRYS